MALSCPPNCIKGTPLWELYDITDNNPEFCLYESVVMEFTDIAGFPVLYYRAKTKMDKLYGEDPNQNYFDPVKTKLYYQPTEEPSITDAFGFRSDETIQYSLIPKGTFTRDIADTTTGVVKTIKDAFGGTGGYVSREGVATTTTGGGIDLRVDITASNGIITKIKINDFNDGMNYAVNDVITITGGNGDATFVVDTVTSKNVVPMPGDVIKTLWNGRNYEIVDVGAEQSIFQGRKLVWEFILRPYRYSEESLMADQIHYTRTGWNYIYVYPDGELADITYPDGTTATGVPIDTLNIDTCDLDCGYKYRRNEDGSFELFQETLVPTDDGTFDEGQHTGQSGETAPISNRPAQKYGDDNWIEVESEVIDNYGDVDTKIFGY